MPSKASNNLVTHYLWWPSLFPSPSPYCSYYLSLLAVAHECQLHPFPILPERLPSQTWTVLITSLPSNLRSGSAQVLPSSPYLKMQASSIWHFWNSLPCFSVSTLLQCSLLKIKYPLPYYPVHLFCPLSSSSVFSLWPATSTKAGIFLISRRVPNFRTVPGT